MSPSRGGFQGSLGPWMHLLCDEPAVFEIRTAGVIT